MKRAKDNRLYSLNDQYPFGEKNDDDHIQVLERVIGIVGEDDIASSNEQMNLEQLLSKELRDFNRKYQSE